MASLDSGQSGFLHQEDAGNQVGFAPSGLLPLYICLCLSRAGALVVVELPVAGVYVSRCVSHSKKVLLHSCVKVSGNNTLTHSASLVPVSSPGLK